MVSARITSTGGFAALKLSEALIAAVTSLGYEEPTPVQRETIPLLLSGRDMLAQAATGTGKTAAFALPMLHRLADDAGADLKVGPKKRRRTRGLILVPTRELAMQVAEAIHKYARGSGIAVVPVYGGASMFQQIRSLERGADVVVATPGRALDLLRRESLDLSSLQMLVLDEADEMLDMGFADDLDAILQATPPERQTALFSATMPPRILSIAQKHLKNPQRITIAREKTAAGKMPRVRQVAYVVSRAHKPSALQRVLDMESPSSALVFCRTRLEVDTLVETLNAHGYRAEALHGDMSQAFRDRATRAAREGRTDILVATDVAARGLDIEQVSHVINYDLPQDPEYYVHRIGRTGRAGRSGAALTFVTPWEMREFRLIERVVGARITRADVPTAAAVAERERELLAERVVTMLRDGTWTRYRPVIEEMAADHDPVDLAAAALALAQDARTGDGLRDGPVDTAGGLEEWLQRPQRPAPWQDRPRGRDTRRPDGQRRYSGPPPGRTGARPQRPGPRRYKQQRPGPR